MHGQDKGTTKEPKQAGRNASRRVLSNECQKLGLINADATSVRINQGKYSMMIKYTTKGTD